MSDVTQQIARLNGELNVEGSAARGTAAAVNIPTAPDGYTQNCGKAARVQVGKAGLRLAAQIKKLIP